MRPKARHRKAGRLSFTTRSWSGGLLPSSGAEPWLQTVSSAVRRSCTSWLPHAIRATHRCRTSPYYSRTQLANNTGLIETLVVGGPGRIRRRWCISTPHPSWRVGTRCAHPPCVSPPQAELAFGQVSPDYSQVLRRVKVGRGPARVPESVAARDYWRPRRGTRPFPTPAHRTVHAVFPHTALGRVSHLGMRRRRQ
jgi:hypothetical protein